MNVPDPPSTEALYAQADEKVVCGILLQNILPPTTLTREHFTEPGCRTVFDAMQELTKQGRPIDTVSVVEFLKSRDALEQIGGGLYVDGLVEAAPPTAHLDYHIERLNLALRRRMLHRAGQRLQAAATDAGSDTHDMLEARCAEIVEDMSGPDRRLDTVDAADWLGMDVDEPVQVLKNAFDLNTKTCITGPSKARKSFFLLQLAVSLSGGSPQFLTWEIQAPRVVLFVNMEIPEGHFHRRLRRMVKALRIMPERLRGRLHILNARGTPSDTVLTKIVTEARRVKAEVVILDPIYKLISGDESKQENVKALLATMDRICSSTGAALVYVHHGTKGEAGDRLTIDRAAGSGVLARDVDALVSLVNHVEDGLLVVEQIARSYPPKDPFTIRWDDDGHCFQVEDGVTPEVRTSFNRKRTGTGKAISDADAAGLVESRPMTHAAFLDALKGLGMAREAARHTAARLVDNGAIQTYRTRTFPTRTYYGTKDGIEKLKHEHENPQLGQ